MVAGSFTRESKHAVSPHKFWKAGAHDGHNVFPNRVPDLISSVEVLEGDGGVGTVKKYNFTDAVKEYRYRTEKTEVMDNENHILKLTVIDGGLLGKRFKSYSSEIKLEAIDGSGTLLKIKTEYDTIDETPLSVEEEDKIVEGLLSMGKGLEEHVAENTTS